MKFFSLKTILMYFYLLLISSNSVYADTSLENLKKLCNAYGVSGFEGDVREILSKYWTENKIQYEIDGMGNLIGKFTTHSETKPTLLVMAHMDEVGFITSEIDDDGFIRVVPLGGWMDHVLWSQKWVIRTPDGQYITAVSGMDAPHVLSDFTKSPIANKNMLFLDTGLSKKELIDLGIRPGLAVIPDFKFQKLSETRYAAKAFDDRVGLAIILDLIRIINNDPKLLSKINVVFAATVQEELGMRGSKVVYESLKPNIVINIEAGIARDYPTQFTKNSIPKLGLGPAIFIYDGSMMPNQNLVHALGEISKKNTIPIQWELELSYGQDASCLQSAGKGMPAVNIGIPVRYAHSHIGIIDRNDYDNSIKLLKEVILHLDRNIINDLRL
ncbi:MAG: hypothetical protein DGJ47_000367 [Rickettsiaceae bacterium]